MARPRTPIGTFGEIHYTPTASGKVQARTRFRDIDGQLRPVTATGDTCKSAEMTLKAAVSQRVYRGLGIHDLGPDSTFARLVEVWLEDLDLEDELAVSTRELYERDMRTLVMPAFEHYRLREITVSRVERFLKTLAKTHSVNYARHAKTVLSLSLGLATRYEAIPKNPVRDVKRMKRPSAEVISLTPGEVEAIRAAVRTWRREPGLPGPRPDGQLEQIIEVLLGTSARIGEVLAIRKCDVDVTVSPSTVHICGTIISPKGKPTFRQDWPKTAKSNRVVAVPEFASEVLRQRLVAAGEEDQEHLIFFSRNHTPLTPNNVRRRLRAILEGVGITGVTPHAFRRTVATTLERGGDADLAAEMLGHTSSEITKKYYITPEKMVNPITAEILASLAPRSANPDPEA